MNPSTSAAVATHAPADGALAALAACAADGPADVSVAGVALLDAAVRALLTERDAVTVVRVAAEGLALDRVAACREPLRRVAAGGGGASVPVVLAASALLADGDVATGRWDEAAGLAACAGGPLERHGAPAAVARLRLAQALMAAARGDELQTRTLAEPVLAWAGPRGVRPLADGARRVLALAALARGDAEAAYRHATGVTEPGRPLLAAAARNVSLDLVEAAVALGRLDDARRHAAAMQASPVRAVSGRFATAAAAAAALVAAPDDAAARFEQALAVPGSGRWPFERARVQLAYGEHLRRQRRAGPSRALLGAALDTFVRLDARPWAARARQGLRATGVTVGRPDLPGPAAALTADERQVVALAAAGLTNRQIARRTGVSHGTAAARLSRALATLGVGSRAALGAATRALDAGEPPRADVALRGIA